MTCLGSKQKGGFLIWMLPRQCIRAHPSLPKGGPFFGILHTLDLNQGADVCEVIVCKRCNLRKLRFHS